MRQLMHPTRALLLWVGLPCCCINAQQVQEDEVAILEIGGYRVLLTLIILNFPNDTY
jgi:hypothetical protein